MASNKAASSCSSLPAAAVLASSFSSSSSSSSSASPSQPSSPTSSSSASASASPSHPPDRSAAATAAAALAFALTATASLTALAVPPVAALNGNWVYGTPAAADGPISFALNAYIPNGDEWNFNNNEDDSVKDQKWSYTQCLNHVRGYILPDNVDLIIWTDPDYQYDGCYIKKYPRDDDYVIIWGGDLNYVAPGRYFADNTYKTFTGISQSACAARCDSNCGAVVYRKSNSTCFYKVFNYPNSNDQRSVIVPWWQWDGNGNYLGSSVWPTALPNPNAPTTTAQPGNPTPAPSAATTNSGGGGDGGSSGGGGGDSQPATVGTTTDAQGRTSFIISAKPSSGAAATASGGTGANNAAGPAGGNAVPSSNGSGAANSQSLHRRIFGVVAALAVVLAVVAFVVVRRRRAASAPLKPIPLANVATMPPSSGDGYGSTANLRGADMKTVTAGAVYPTESNAYSQDTSILYASTGSVHHPVQALHYPHQQQQQQQQPLPTVADIRQPSPVASLEKGGPAMTQHWPEQVPPGQSGYYHSTMTAAATMDPSSAAAARSNSTRKPPVTDDGFGLFAAAGASYHTHHPHPHHHHPQQQPPSPTSTTYSNLRHTPSTKKPIDEQTFRSHLHHRAAEPSSPGGASGLGLPSSSSSSASVAPSQWTDGEGLPAYEEAAAGARGASVRRGPSDVKSDVWRGGR
ncbi:hypothetical protein DFJ73DRAFT_776676 [Zopfochytrium polystomum]|nr:hypothetical protein DFJ73DRAFT_776676 [Zopfochytrium polystomum]